MNVVSLCYYSLPAATRAGTRSAPQKYVTSRRGIKDVSYDGHNAGNKPANAVDAFPSTVVVNTTMAEMALSL